MSYTPVPSSGAAGGGVAVSAGGASVSAGTVVMSNSNNVSFGLNGSTVTASAAAAPNMSFWQNQNAGNNGALIQVATLNTPIFVCLNEMGGMPGAMTINTMALMISNSTNISSVTAHTVGVSFGLYSLSNSTRLALLNSASFSTGTNASVDSAYQSWYAGQRALTIASSQWSAQPVVTAGGSYWLGIVASTAGASIGMLVAGQGQLSQQSFYGEIGSSFTSRQHVPFAGAYSTTTNALPASVSMGEVVNSAVYGIIPLVQFAQGISWLP